MITEIGSRLRITNPSPDMVDWCKKHLEIPNPEYQKKARMNLWLGDTPRTLVMYEVDGDSVIIPFGCLRSILPLLEGDVKKLFTKQVKVDYKGAKVPLYDYQEEAVGAMIINHYGILQSPAGSGKTQIGIALACSMRLKTLWLTHTKDLLTQSKNRAAQYIDKSLLGTITEGKVNIGETMTFATIQTMCKVDLNQYRDTWDCIIVDECHRVAGTPTAVTQFSKVLNTLRARHKYGLSATVHRADGLIKATYAMLGHVIYTVPDEAVKSRVMMVDVQPKGTGVKLDSAFLNSDGTINYCKMITYLTTHTDRNQIIMNDLVGNREHYNLILSERVDHLKLLYEGLPPDLKSQAAVIDGSMTTKKKKAEREQAIEDMRTGKGIAWEWVNRCTTNPARTDFIKKVQKVCALYREGLMQDGKVNPVTGIFWQKNYDGMKDQTEMVLTPNNPLGDSADTEALARKYLDNADIVDVPEGEISEVAERAESPKIK